MSPLVSVVIPTYNRAADLRRALASVVAQTWEHWEALVVDNHSSDDTIQVVESFADPRIRLLSVHNHGVIAVSRNLGVARSRGTYVALLDSDDWWFPDKLTQSVQRLEAGADVVYHDLYIVWSARQQLYWRKRVTRRLRAPTFDDLMWKGNAICNSSVVVRRRVLEGIGGFSEDRSLIAWEDYDAWLRLARASARFERLDRALGCYWAGGGNVSSPERTIRNLECFRQLYIAPEPRWRDRTLPGWYHYALGLAYYELRSYATAFDHMRRALGAGGLPVKRYVRALLTAIASSGRLLSGAAR